MQKFDATMPVRGGLSWGLSPFRLHSCLPIRRFPKASSPFPIPELAEGNLLVVPVPWFMVDLEKGPTRSPAEPPRTHQGLASPAAASLPSPSAPGTEAQQPAAQGLPDHWLPRQLPSAPMSHNPFQMPRAFSLITGASPSAGFHFSSLQSGLHKHPLPHPIGLKAPSYLQLPLVGPALTTKSPWAWPWPWPSGRRRPAHATRLSDHWCSGPTVGLIGPGGVSPPLQSEVLMAELPPCRARW